MFLTFTDLKQNGSDHDDEESCGEDDESLHSNVAPEYKRLITIRAGKPKGRVILALLVDPNEVKRLSLSEEQLAKAAQDHGKELIRYVCA